ncbi:hypothetical protein Tcan_00790, partial [Toxocara canis]
PCCRLWCACFVALLILPVSNHLVGPPHLEQCLCDVDSLPPQDDIVWLPNSYPPCLHRGQAVLLWNSTACNSPFSIRSASVSLDIDSGLLFIERRICFYSTIWRFGYYFKCAAAENVYRKNTLRIGHDRFSRQSRKKRWLRRRNPPAQLIHFQQDRYI